MQLDHLLRAAVFFLLGLFWFVPLKAQQSAGKHSWLRVEMKDGSVFVGRRLAMTDEELILDTEGLGKLNLPLAGVREIREMGALPGRFRFDNVAANQNILSPNAFGIRKGQKQYSNFMLGYNQLSWGLSERFSLYVGMELFTLLIAATDGEFVGPGILLRPHFSIPVKQDKLTLGMGIAAGGLIASGALGFAPYGSFALGDRDRNVNVNVGAGIGGDGFSPPFFSVNGNLRLTPKFGLNMENWFFPSRFETVFINSFGVRIYGERASWSIALVGAGSEFFYELSPLPLGGLIVSF